MANDRNWGGTRPGAGRKKGTRTSSLVAHRKRPHYSDKPLLGALTFAADIDLRIAARIVREQARHEESVHGQAGLLNVERRGRTILFEFFGTMAHLPAAAQRFATRVARRINRAMRRRGRVFRDRYRMLTPPYVPPPPPTLAERVKERALMTATILLLGAGGAVLGATTRRYPRLR